MLNKKNIFIAVTFVIFLGIAIHFINYQLQLLDDNELEEAAEEFVSKKLFINIDFTPLTPEKHE